MSSISRYLQAALLAAIGAFTLGTAMPAAAGGVATLVVPFSPASGPDIVARSLADGLARETGNTVIVENRTGASGEIGMRFVSRAHPDGLTLLVAADPPLTVNQFVKKQALPEPLKLFAPISELATGTMALVVSNSLKVTDVKSFVAYAKAHPDEVNYGSPGIGTPQHLTMEFFKSAAGISVRHVPFKDAGGATTALLGGLIGAAFLPIQVALPLSHERVRILGVSSAQRVKSASEIPTISEQGYQGFESYFRIGILAPKGTPADLIASYSKILAKLVQGADVAERFSRLGMIPLGSSPAEYAKTLTSDEAKWKKVIGNAKITAE